ncbi:glycine cleavage system aminomethyltransferase T [Blattabacterium sp. (Blattella germanica) str. Bge]|uniref:glycine cleavage system aminomethyltransferase GcvT n=1 Tax=Blattabacterium sp. (Blattella germanica) TaxID=624186 RepID=UPI0001BB6108|nr:glycine cleavage system aminomethyltransferase GcvT [Blattabacterium sp. (Blattella germanica)]ACY40210.1 glycine cleavage system aminomethyltransferase T [Blattabacterium sp. (Blattella germanica) str. Bge]
MTENNLKKTILYENHIRLGAKMVNYSGFYMPLQYTSSLKEHMSVRNNAGIFDVSHMGKFILSGKDSMNLIQYLTTNDLSKIKIGQAQYNCFINEHGGIIDDLVVYKITEKKLLLIVNAANIEKNKKWINHHIKKNAFSDIELIDFSSEYSLLAIQGPFSLFYIQKLTNIPLQKIPFYHFEIGEFAEIQKVLISCTGYTGSKGVEIYIPNEYAEKIWNKILEIKKIIPCGIASRNSLRLEMGYRLWGKDLCEKTTPIEAGLSWITKFEKKFLAKEILQKQKNKGEYKKFISFVIEEKGKIPRDGYSLIDKDNNIIGNVTSGTFSPILKKGIGLGYLWNQKINSVFLSIRKKKIPIKMVKLPFINIKNS